jgi:hypothetical protein
MKRKVNSMRASRVDQRHNVPAPKANVPGKNARTTKIARGKIKEDPDDLGILARLILDC